MNYLFFPIKVIFLIQTDFVILKTKEAVLDFFAKDEDAFLGFGFVMAMLEQAHISMIFMDLIIIKIVNTQIGRMKIQK